VTQLLSKLACLCLLLPTGAAARIASYAEVQSCRDAAEEGEFLQSCVKLLVTRRAGTVLGPGLVAPGGRVAAVLHHKRYGSVADRVTVRIYGPDGKLAGSFPMGSAGDEYALAWAPGSSRYLAWVEVDGRGGTLKVADWRRRRIAISAASPLEEWPIFAPKGVRLMIPRGGDGVPPGSEPVPDPTAEQVQFVEVIDLLDRARQTVLRAGKGEELVGLRWISADTVGATLRKLGAAKGKPVQGRLRVRASRPTSQPSDEQPSETEQ
jgi:hypothetical protein